MNENFQEDILSEDEHIAQDDLNKALGFDLTKDMLKPYEHERLVTFLQTTTPVELNVIQPVFQMYGLTGLRTIWALDKIGRNYAWGLVGGSAMAFSTAVAATKDPGIQDGYQHLSQIYLIGFRAILEIDEQATLVDTADFTPDEMTANSITYSLRLKTANAINAILGTSNEIRTQTDVQKYEDVVRERIQSISVDAFVFTSICKTLSKQGDLDFNEMHDVILTSQQGSELSEEQRADIFTMIVKGYEQYPERYDDDFILKIKTMLPGKLKSPNTKFYTLTKGDELISTLRFDSIYDAEGALTSKYLGSFSLDTAYHNGAIGQALFAEALKEEEEADVPIQLHCDARPGNKPVQDLYTSHGFTIIETDTTYTPSVPLLFMEQA